MFFWSHITAWGFFLSYLFTEQQWLRLIILHTLSLISHGFGKSHRSHFFCIFQQVLTGPIPKPWLLPLWSMDRNFHPSRPWRRLGSLISCLGWIGRCYQIWISVRFSSFAWLVVVRALRNVAVSNFWAWPAIFLNQIQITCFYLCFTFWVFC